MGIGRIFLARFGRLFLVANTFYWTYFYSLIFGHMGRKVTMYGKIYIQGPEKISVGNRTIINHGCSFYGKGGIEIGSNVLIGQNVNIMTNNYIHSDTAVPIRDQGQVYKKVVIGDGVWICANAIILPGVRIGKHAIVGAGAVVTKDVKDYSVVVGNPAREIHSRLKKVRA